MCKKFRQLSLQTLRLTRLAAYVHLHMQVYQRQLMKQDLSKSVVDDGNASGPQKGSFSTEELRALFKAGAACVSRH